MDQEPLPRGSLQVVDRLAKVLDAVPELAGTAVAVEAEYSPAAPPGRHPAAMAPPQVVLARAPVQQLPGLFTSSLVGNSGSDLCGKNGAFRFTAPPSAHTP